jgi:ATP-grasp domain, R2K clade family 3
VCGRLIELRGDQFVGGVVLRAFETFVGPEIRSWWINGELVMKTPHPDVPLEVAVTVDMHAFDLSSFVGAVDALDCPFVALDVVANADGELRVVEVGDGQVSDVHECVDPTTFVRMLARLA